MATLMAILCLKHIGGFSGFMEAIHSQGLENDFRMVTTGRPDEIITRLSLDRFEHGDIQTDAFVVG